jgi:hypothetical protein
MPATDPTAPPPEFLRKLEGGADDRRAARSSGDPRLQVRAWHAAEGSSAAPVAAEPGPAPAGVIRGVFQVRTIKVTIVVRPEDALALESMAGAAPIPVVIRIDVTRKYTAMLNSKTVRKVQAAIREAGPDGVAVVLQGKLDAGDRIGEAGLIAQLRQPKLAAPSAQTGLVVKDKE